MSSDLPADVTAAGDGREIERVELRFEGIAPVSVRGPVTDVLYRFSEQCPVQAVDARDAQPILSTRLFRRVP
jgi:hypothetical protein